MKKAAILKALINGQKLTVLSAVKKFNTVDLRKRISELRREGFKINDEWCVNNSTKSRYKSYWIKK